MLDSKSANSLTKIAAGGISGRGPSSLCTDGIWDAALGLIRAARRVAVVTGFFIPSAGAPETDGPTGSVALAMSLGRFGLDAEIWTDFRCVGAVKVCAAAAGLPEEQVVDVSGDIDGTESPDLLIYVERLGRAPDGAYYDMRKNDVSAFTSPLDEFALRGDAKVIGIGDGGNETGMANYSSALAGLMPDYAACLSAVGADVAIPVDVSNWGAYALCAALSLEAGKWLAQSEDGEIKMIEALVRAGAVDGMKKTASLSVDGFGIAKQAEIIRALRSLL